MKQRFNGNKHPKTFSFVSENDTVTTRCNRCGCVVLREPEETYDEYPYQCLSCDENMFEFETHEGEPHSDKEFDDLCCLARDIFNLDN
jgi:hypothetical protein